MNISLAGGVILDESSRILLLHRNTDALTQWELPGGKVQPPESSQSAVARELREELGIEVTVGIKLGETAFKQAEREYRYEWFGAVITRGMPEPREAMHDECRYIGIQELRELAEKLATSPNLNGLLQAVENGEVRLSS